MSLLIAFLLLCSTAWAGQTELDAERARLAAKGRPAPTAAEETQLMTRGWRDRRTGEFDPPVSNLSRPVDYVNPVRRGILEYSMTWRNYAWHTIKVPSGTVIDCREGGNFAQLVPNTAAFVRTNGFGRNLTFIECNLTNIRTFADWTLQGCNTAQVWMKGSLDPDGNPDVTETEFVASRSEDVPAIIVAPVGALQ